MPRKKRKKENAPSAANVTEKAFQIHRDNCIMNETESQEETAKNITKNEEVFDDAPQYQDGKRQSFFAFLVYPDSAPPNWVELLGDKRVRAYVSPLHDSDKNPDGTQKKPHYHVLLQFDSLKSVEQFTAIRDSVGGVGREEVASGRGYARYLIHKDNPEKAQYKREDILELSGADWDELTRREADGVKELLAMKDFIDEQEIFWFDDFDRYCRKHNPTWAELLSTRYTYAVYTYIKARAKHHEALMQNMSRAGYTVNMETGEFIDRKEKRNESDNT